MRPKRLPKKVVLVVVTFLCFLARQAQLVSRSINNGSQQQQQQQGVTDAQSAPPTSIIIRQHKKNITAAAITPSSTPEHNNNNVVTTTSSNNVLSKEEGEARKTPPVAAVTETNKVVVNDNDNDDDDDGDDTKVTEDEPRCALMFFGLPRSFDLLVLPSIEKNILIPNKNNRCDIFVHFYLVQSEGKGRSGVGGTIDPMEVFNLKDSVRELYSRDEYPSNNINSIPLVSFTNDTDADFHRKRGKQIEKYHNTKDSAGNYLYFPWQEPSYKYPSTMDNIVKQWHSIQSVWEHMTRTAKQLKRNYTRVAMLRNDVMYMTPFDIYKRGINTTIDKTNNTDVLIPNWARFPINDRMIYGPHDAVRVWATERFERLETHVRNYEPGWGMHSERFLEAAIFPAIKALGYGVVTDPDICFFRARADGSTWITDCTTQKYGRASGFRKVLNVDAQALVEAIVERPCVKTTFKDRIIQVHCLLQGHENGSDNATSTTRSTSITTTLSSNNSSKMMMTTAEEETPSSVVKKESDHNVGGDDDAKN
jgi:hypothetical protein